MFTPADRKRALRALTRFFTMPEFREMHRVAHADFWPDWVPDLDEEQRRRLEAVSGESEAIYLTWIAFDNEFANGRPLVDVLLDARGERLSPGERDYLRRLRDSYLGLYEVVEVRPEEGLRLRDLWKGGVVWVRERKATRQVARWDVLLARLVPQAGGEYVMEGSVLMFPVLAAEEILRELRRAHPGFHPPVPRRRWRGVLQVGRGPAARHLAR